jgi:hypothetical protein
MKNTTRHAVAVIGTFAAATSVVALAPAQAADDLAPSTVKVRTTDDTPASGETFRLKGAAWSEGERVPAAIRVQAWRNGEWVQLHGARMHTNSDDLYNMRIILQQKGERTLRVVANPDGDDIKAARQEITVTVH